MMKKILMMLSLFTLVLAACSSKDNGKEKPAKLVVSTWGFADDFFRPEVYEPFEKKHNVAKRIAMWMLSIYPTIMHSRASMKGYLRKLTIAKFRILIISTIKQKLRMALSMDQPIPLHNLGLPIIPMN